MKSVVPLLAYMMLASCTETNVGKPNSIGEPYDITLVASDSNMLNTAKGMLATTVDCMPQQETLFNVKTLKGRNIDAATQYDRTIILVRRGGDHTNIRYEENPYARNQMLVTITTPSQAMFRADSAKTARSLQKLLERVEKKRAINALSKNCNKRMMQEVAKTVGCKITIPDDMKASKKGKDFIWISDNGVKTMRNICVYAAKGIHSQPDDILRVRDSVMAENIKGEREGMVMATERKADVKFNRLGNGTVARGLWQMKGDAMGGPFVSITLCDTIRNRTVTAEAFIYAPSTTKARAMKRLEATLYTLKTE